MYGYPKQIATRTDAEYLLGYLGSPWATPENIQRGLLFFEGMLAHAKSYVFDRNLAEGEEPDPDCIVLVQEDGTRRQEALADDPAALIYRMGYTVAEVEAIITQIKEA
jgi:hypothetical protein